eukprot:TRINITY_DN6647_c0_g1_i6.p1 TRINITY_DN6647_c0_g1~~TRINITY_DN6647_c0_g1_i6.p1  ORF type:complete len:221 (-),score=42.92 TRINITY_DN6647_c0_g1_i6:71-709(-)
MSLIKTTVLTAILVTFCGSSARFCPRERRQGFECRAKADKFKCGIFFENLLGGRELKWIGALPDAIARAERSNVQDEIFPKVNGQPVQKSYFGQWSRKCDPTEANAKCYLLMSQLADDKLDSCKKTVGNLDGDDTIGNQLCDQARRFLQQGKKDISRGVRNQNLAFYSSTCQEEWTPVTSSQRGNLLVDEKLCCDNNWKYVKCNGGSFRKTC